MARLDAHGEGRVDWYAVAWLRVGDDGGDHVGGGRDAAHGDAVARAGRVLLPIGKGTARAEVDEVGRVTSVILSVLVGASEGVWEAHVADSLRPSRIPGVPSSSPVYLLAVCRALGAKHVVVGFGHGFRFEPRARISWSGFVPTASPATAPRQERSNVVVVKGSILNLSNSGVQRRDVCTYIQCVNYTTSTGPRGHLKQSPRLENYILATQSYRDGIC